MEKNQSLFQLCDRGGEEWALIISSASEEEIQRVWAQVMEEEEVTEDAEYEPLEVFLERIPGTYRVEIESYIKP